MDNLENWKIWMLKLKLYPLIPYRFCCAYDLDGPVKCLCDYFFHKKMYLFCVGL